jgi:hypothetical protein
MPLNWIVKSRSLIPLAVFLLTGCGALNPFCGSARPKPILTALAPTTATFVQIQAGFLVTVTGSRFVSSSVILWNGVALPTTVISNTQLQVTITPTQASAPGNSQVAVHTPANTAGDLGCDSGGNSQALTFTVT